MWEPATNRRLVSEINVVPYIDVMLVLLIIFMVTAPLLQQGVTVELPEASAKVLPPDSVEPLVVSVDAKGRFYLNVSDKPNVPMEARPLMVRIGAELSRTPDRQVLVKGDKTVNYGAVVEAMVLLQKAGAKGVGLITEQPKQRT